MSLFKQLWLAIIVLFTVVLSSSIVVNCLSSRNYLEQELHVKNVDNAAALALALSQQEADPALLELTISAQFDTGHYQLIRISDPQGKLITERTDYQLRTGAPAWFMQLLPIEVAPGIAQVQQGWQQLGTVTVQSHSRFAYKALWRNSQWLVLIFLLAMLAAGVLGSYLLKRILQPLDQVVEQAEAIGNRRFVTSPEPATVEFRRVVAAMNNLSDRIKVLLNQEAGRMEKWRKESHVDRVTGLLNRDQFMKQLETALARDDASASGVLCMVRLAQLAQLNQIYGRVAVDSALSEMGKALNRVAMQDSGWAASRLNGSDFAMVAPRTVEPMMVATQLRDALQEVLVARRMQGDTNLPGAATVFGPDDGISELLTRLDGALLASDREGESAIAVTGHGDFQIMPVREQLGQWRGVFKKAFAGQMFSLASFPVVTPEGKLLHTEAPVRLTWREDKLSAGQILPWINRLDLAADLDKRVVDLALQRIEQEQQPLCINLSVAALIEPSFLMWISERFSSNPKAASLLWLELAEPMAYRYLENFKKLCSRARSFDCKVGIEHMGHQVAKIGLLHDIGLDYFKIDASLVRGIDNNAANQSLVRTLCSVGHSIGVAVIAEGVGSESERNSLIDLGIDGLTGPLIVS